MKNFSAAIKTGSLTPEVDLYFGNELAGSYDLPSDKQIGCNWLVDGSCPLDVNEDATYHLKMLVPPVPTTLVGIVFRLKNSEGRALFCMRVDLDVKA